MPSIPERPTFTFPRHIRPASSLRQALKPVCSRLLALTLLLALATGADAREAAPLPSLPVEELLVKLDSALAGQQGYEAAKQTRIDRLRSNLSGAADTEQRYWIASELYDEYSTYDSDSALTYASMAEELAGKAGRKPWVTDMRLNKAYLYAATGILERADRCIAEIDTAALTDRQRLRYNEQVLYLMTHRDQYLGASSVDYPYGAVADSLLANVCRGISPDDPMYCWFVGWQGLRGADDARGALPLVREKMEGSRYETRHDAMNAWVLSRLYEKTGDQENMLRYLVLSSLADVRACNKEIASLEEVANLLYTDHRNLKRANDYISHCIRCANEYKSRVRVGRLADLQHRITRDYQTELERQEHRASTYLKLLGAIMLGLLAAMAFIIIQMKKLRQSRAMLNDANLALNGKVKELEEVKEKLEEANETLAGQYSNAREGANELSRTNLAKEKYIADIFAICSNYISKLDDFRKNIYRLLLAGKYEDLRHLTKTPELSQAEIKELHRTFDKIFLGIYPDFVRDFNTLLRPEEQIELKKDDLLNTELRIYALVRLGLTDSTAIARFLHCSVQTVYNTRQRTRSKANVPREEFAERVRSLGKTIF